ncbi:MAG: hypothetical protein AB9836_05165, partial [Aminipila sp.]
FFVRRFTGKYIITKYSFTKNNNIFDLASKLGLSNKFKSALNLDYKDYTTPDMDILTETISNTLHVTSSITGAGAHIVVIEPSD